MSGFRNKGPDGPLDLMRGAPTSRPGNARAIGDLGPGRLSGANNAASASIISSALASNNPAVQAVAASSALARVRNDNVIAARFSAPGNATAPQSVIYGFTQQILPQNPNRKFLQISPAYFHESFNQANNPTISYCFPPSFNVGILFNSGPSALTIVNTLSQLQSLEAQAYFPIYGGLYTAMEFDLPPTNPITILAWQWQAGAGTFVAPDINVTVLEGT